MTSGFIVTAEGVIVIDTGGSLANAQAIHAAIRQVTTKPVIYAVNTGGQDHRWFGNDYFKRQGASIVAAEAAVRDIREHGANQEEATQSLLKEKFDGTRFAGVSARSRDPALRRGRVRSRRGRRESRSGPLRLPGKLRRSRLPQPQRAGGSRRDFSGPAKMVQFAGMVMIGTCGTEPVSAIEENMRRKVKARFETGSRSSIQNQ
jgi:hypothetical protein